MHILPQTINCRVHQYVCHPVYRRTKLRECREAVHRHKRWHRCEEALVRRYSDMSVAHIFFGVALLRLVKVQKLDEPLVDLQQHVISDAITCDITFHIHVLWIIFLQDKGKICVSVQRFKGEDRYTRVIAWAEENTKRISLDQPWYVWLKLGTKHRPESE